MLSLDETGLGHRTAGKRITMPYQIDLAQNAWGK
jgi:hypothetical protein